MTLGRPGRGPLGRDDRRHPGVAEPWSGAVEIEELPAQPVLARGRRAPGLGGMLAIGAAVLLLAGGIGVLGGRPQPTSPTAAGEPSGSLGNTTAEFTGEPLVTPARRCGSSPSGPPGVLLEVGGVSTLGALEVLERQPASPGSEGIPTPEPPARVDIRSDVVAEVWTAGRACAVGWTIEVIDVGRLDVIELMGNPDRIPGFASQNRFRVVLAPYAGESIDLRVTLVFPSFTARATWPIRVLPFQPPAAVLSLGTAPIPIVAGCHVELTLGNGWQEAVDPCYGDVEADLATPAVVEPGAGLRFRFDSGGWQIGAVTVSCGALDGSSFVGGDRPDCGTQLDVGLEAFEFAMPDVSGTWVVAIETCATLHLADATNRICGTWYANVEVRA